LASFNVENPFARPRAFNQTTRAQGQPILQAYAEFNSLIEQPAYSPTDKAYMIDLLVQLDVYRVTNGTVRATGPPPHTGPGCAPTAAPSTSSTPTPAPSPAAAHCLTDSPAHRRARNCQVRSRVTIIEAAGGEAIVLATSTK
jgi:hypothetical protein